MIFLLVTGSLTFLIWVGYEIGQDRAHVERKPLDVQRDVLDAEWMALEQARKVNEVFFWARDAMRRAEHEAGRPSSREPSWPAEAGRPRFPGPKWPDEDSGPSVVDGRWE
ncbi:hypothetical protein LWC34_43135 [Kibdelosporangium philippinense]|uniref:Uncharacterized protein n=1 Tax=Kibdelosporangium philippinense TaxID=211113 RepID=A0ABS8ZSZ1_9PSEU|nr:hypothetical protein [Kibdelosporangium philippinense]MCE7009558.1 hypothetical protein [Kibdelosporangium philippinense]